MQYPVSIDMIEKKFFERGKDFKKFSNISAKDKAQIETEANQFKKRVLTQNNLYAPKIQLYEKTLLYLTTPTTSLQYKTFDEKVLFLISCVDPELQIFSSYLSSSIPTLEEICTLPIEQQIEEEQIRLAKIEELKKEIFSKIGIHNTKLLKYESSMYRRYNKGFKVNVKINYLTSLLNHAQNIKDFESLSDEDIAKINMIAEYYLTKTNNETNPNTAAFNILTQRARLLLQSLPEELAFFITITDPELKLLQIYEEESTIPNIRQRAINELGYYDQNILRLEKRYHQRFYPDKKISPWST